jgi:hypothetical protein
VRANTFPAEEHCYRMIEGEFEKFEAVAIKYKKA